MYSSTIKLYIFYFSDQTFSAIKMIFNSNFWIFQYDFFVDLINWIFFVSSDHLQKLVYFLDNKIV